MRSPESGTRYVWEWREQNGQKAVAKGGRGQYQADAKGEGRQPLLMNERDWASRRRQFCLYC